MKFGATLKESIYEPWSESYIDYARLKKLLREDESEGEGSQWTDDDEAKFVEELLNTQLEKVNSFQGKTYKNLQDRTNQCETRLQNVSKDEDQLHTDGDATVNREVKEVLQELDNITKEVNELQKFSRVSYTGFLKAAKKHDRRRGAKYKVRPLLQVRLSALPFNSEDYTPLLYEISMMYSFARRTLDTGSEESGSRSNSKSGGDRFTSYKFWVHPDNLLEIKTYILRRLPVLVYNPKSTRVAEASGSDPSVTSLYFDNDKFSLYDNKLGRTGSAASLRLRWFGHLADKPEILFEKKTVDDNDDSEEIRIPIKEKYVKSFIEGEYKFVKNLAKLRGREGTEGSGVAAFKRNVDDIQTFIRENGLQPVLRVNNTRTAFQIPGDDGVRISIDTDLAFIREDSFSEARPCRGFREWHRGDIDRLGLKYPFSEIRQGELSRFPHAVLDVKVRKGTSKKTTSWVHELMSSHLVKEAPRFSKFVHGVASLFEDYVNSFPFWLSDLETDIRRDPEDAFREEQERKAKLAADEQAVGSFIGSRSKSFKATLGSPVSHIGQSFLESKQGSMANLKNIRSQSEDQQSHQGSETQPTGGGMFTNMLSFTPFSNSRYARAHRANAVQLPPGVWEPKTWIKDMNPVQVEPKVWLANERTFVKWQHVSILLASLSLGLYNAAGRHSIATGLAVIYTLIAIFAAIWGWWMYIVRCRMIEARSGKDFDNVIGPIVICLGLAVALILNFGLKVCPSHIGVETVY